MDKMKIIQVIGTLGNGGAEKLVAELSNELVLKHDVLLISLKRKEGWENPSKRLLKERAKKCKDKNWSIPLHTNDRKILGITKRRDHEVERQERVGCPEVSCRVHVKEFCLYIKLNKLY